jgi:hypothetical protein
MGGSVAGSGPNGNRPSTCDDGVIDALEIAIDCGGPCGLCDTQPCEADADCRYNVCEDGRCSHGTCNDGVRNALEADVDCGSQACQQCETGAHCYELREGLDCKSHVCAAGVCAAPTCEDGRLNQTEGDTDCGGPCPKKCSVGAACLRSTDCENGSCLLGQTGNRCQLSHCVNEVKDEGETGIDCGGPECARCPFT